MPRQSVLNKVNSSFADLSFVKDVATPSDLELVTHYGQEVAGTSVGVSSKQMQKIRCPKSTKKSL